MIFVSDTEVIMKENRDGFCKGCHGCETPCEIPKTKGSLELSLLLQQDEVKRLREAEKESKEITDLTRRLLWCTLNQREKCPGILTALLQKVYPYMDAEDRHSYITKWRKRMDSE